MRHIQITDGLRVNFPGRSDDFAEGVEIGILAALLACGSSPLAAQLSPQCIEQARVLSERMGYVLQEQPSVGWVTLTRREPKSEKPALKLVHSCETA